MNHIKGLALTASTIALTCAGQAALAEDNAQFTFAAPPITDPVQPGEESSRANLSYVGLDGDPSFTMIGLGATDRSRPAGGGRGTATNWQLLFGGDDAGDSTLIGYNMNGTSEAGDALSIPYLGFNLGTNYIGMDMDTVSTDILSLNLGLSIGYIHHFELAPAVILSPYASYGGNFVYASVTSEFDTQTCYTSPTTGNTSCYDSSTTNDDSISTFTTMLTLGFDISFHGFSLASMASMGEEDMTMINLSIDI